MKENIKQLSAELGLKLEAKNYMLALAESCTGGGLAFAVTGAQGSSNWFERGFVTYTNQAKMDLLGVSADTLQNHGAVSEETAAEMAQGVLANSPADIALSITGIAGPSGGSPEKPVGTVCFGLAVRGESIQTQHQLFKGDREQIRNSAIAFAFEWLIAVVS